MNPLLEMILMALGAWTALTYSPLLVAVPIMAIMPERHKEAGNWLGEIFVQWVERRFDRMTQYVLIPVTMPIGFWLIGLGHLALVLMVLVNLSRERGANACYWLRDVLE